MHKMSRVESITSPGPADRGEVEQVAEALSSSTESDMNGDILRGATKPDEEDIEDRSLPARRYHK